MKAISRREAIQLTGTGLGLTLLAPSLLAFENKQMMKRKIPSSGELLPVIGLGTWQTFDVGNNQEQRTELLNVLKEMKTLGGAMIDSSPMYGSSEQVLGDLSKKIRSNSNFFYATKVWTHGKEDGIEQMESSMQKMNRKQMDLMQIHNLVEWKTHIKTLRDWKDKGKIRYWGFTHYTNSSHTELEKLIKNENPDFVQFNYAINDHHAEKRLLNVAKENGTAVIINRPYNGGNLFRLTRGKEIPYWCKELDINSWGQYFLKYILSHEAVNCVIPGTSKVKHVIDNMGAGYGRLPNQNERQKMVDHLSTL